MGIIKTSLWLLIKSIEVLRSVAFLILGNEVFFIFSWYVQTIEVLI